jgi:predicted amidohydrolase
MPINKESIHISLIQMDIAWKNIQDNLKKIEQLFLQIPHKTEIVILPEMFSTGFTMDTSGLTSPLGEYELNWLKEQAKKIKKIIVGSVLTEKNKQYYNRMYWMWPDGNYEFYDKRHLFHMGGEHQLMTAGKERKIVEYKGMKFMLQICYDLRFPVWSKNTYNKQKDIYEYDALIYIANWPESRKQAYLNLLNARAIENQAYVIWVNRVGTDGKNIMHSGDSRIIAPDGTKINSLPPFSEKILDFELHKETVKNLRDNFKVGLDWDDFIIKI